MATQIKPHPLLSVKEAADVLGLPLRTVYRMVENGALPHVKSGRRILIARGQLEQWLGVPPGSLS